VDRHRRLRRHTQQRKPNINSSNSKTKKHRKHLFPCCLLAWARTPMRAAILRRRLPEKMQALA
jgi:hypothetical protein